MSADKPLWWANELSLLLSNLPSPKEPKWTAKQKRLWLYALEKVLDLLIEIEDESKQPPEPAAAVTQSNKTMGAV